MNNLNERGHSRRKWINRIMLGLSGTATAITILILALILGYTLVRGISYVNLNMLTHFSPGATIASTIANQFGEATTGVYTGSLIELALILFGVTLIVNIVARTLVWRMTSVKAAKE